MGKIIQYAEVKFMEAYTQDWRALSEAASREQDPEKLMQLVEELNRALLVREQECRRAVSKTAN
ncbi:MAG: hypothetical protein J2P13_05555 [Acidobacteria bacterium]|nr:hypothetical protein [Acidobacteriota bacterium]